MYIYMCVFCIFMIIFFPFYADVYIVLHVVSAHLWIHEVGCFVPILPTTRWQQGKAMIISVAVHNCSHNTDVNSFVCIRF